MVSRILDDGSGVTNQGGVEAELSGDGQSPAIASSGAEDRSNPGLGRACHRGSGPWAQGAVGIEERAVHIERQDLISSNRHELLPNRESLCRDPDKDAEIPTQPL